MIKLDTPVEPVVRSSSRGRGAALAVTTLVGVALVGAALILPGGATEAGIKPKHPTPTTYEPPPEASESASSSAAPTETGVVEPSVVPTPTPTPTDIPTSSEVTPPVEPSGRETPTEPAVTP